jgi:hypothetical protein
VNGPLYLALPVIAVVAVILIGRLLLRRPDSYTELADLCRSAHDRLFRHGHRVDWGLPDHGTVAGLCARCGGTATIVAAERPGAWEVIFGRLLADGEQLLPCGARR